MTLAPVTDGVCCVCLLQQPTSFHDMSSGSPSWAEKLRQYLPKFDLGWTRILQRIICEQCSKTLDRMVQFQKMCADSNERLKKYIKQTKIKNKNIYLLASTDVANTRFEYHIINDSEFGYNLIIAVDKYEENFDGTKMITLKSEQNSHIVCDENNEQMIAKFDDLEFIDEMHLENYLTKENMNIICLQCNRIIQDYHQFLLHVESHMKQNIYKYSEAFQLKYKLIGKFECTICFEVYDKYLHCGIHMGFHAIKFKSNDEKSKISEINKCVQCLKEFSNSESLLCHRKVHELDLDIMNARMNMDKLSTVDMCSIIGCDVNKNNWPTINRSDITSVLLDHTYYSPESRKRKRLEAKDREFKWETYNDKSINSFALKALKIECATRILRVNIRCNPEMEKRIQKLTSAKLSNKKIKHNSKQNNHKFASIPVCVHNFMRNKMKTGTMLLKSTSNVCCTRVLKSEPENSI